MTQALIIAHKDCRDGLAAAWVAKKYINSTDRQADVFFAEYKTEPPWELIKDRDVYVLDFCYPRSVMDKIEEEAQTLTCLDHHQSNQRDLEGFACAIFDMNRSGAGLTWDYFYPNQARPWIVDYIEDRDLWWFKLPDSEAINAYLSTMPLTMDAISNAWLAGLNGGIETVKAMGYAVLSKTQNYVQEAVKHAIRIDFEGYNIPVVNAQPTDMSEVLNALAEGEPFAMGWFQRSDGHFQYSLRSKGGVDVSEVAKRYEGGGHPKASGFKQEYPFHLDHQEASPWRQWAFVALGVTMFWIAVTVLTKAFSKAF